MSGGRLLLGAFAVVALLLLLLAAPLRPSVAGAPHRTASPRAHSHLQPQPRPQLQPQPLQQPSPAARDDSARAPRAASGSASALLMTQPAAARLLVERARARGEPEPGSPMRGGFDDSEHARKESENVRRLLRFDWDDGWHASVVAQRSGQPAPLEVPPYSSLDDLLAEVPVGGTALVGFGSAGVLEMLVNWAHHVVEAGLGRSMLVGAFDNTAATELSARGLPVYNLSGALPPEHFRHAPYLFHRMGFLKAELILQVINLERYVIVSDSDVVWRRSPLPLFERLRAAGANVASSTDCLNAAVDAGRVSTDPKQQYAGCGHRPGSTWGAVFNTGVLWFAPDDGARRLLHSWANATLYLDDQWSDDQGVFNRLLTARGFYPVRAAAEDGSVVHGPEGAFAPGVRIGPIPADSVCSGHLVWVQQGGKPRDCLAVHLTFTEYGDAGKRWRMLESGMWAPLTSSYFEEGRYLAFEPPAAGDDPGRETNGEDPKHGLGPRKPGDMFIREALQRSLRLRGQVDLMGRQVHALRDALALARVLNRTLILPHFECLCDRSELSHVVPSCIFPGAPAEIDIPFQCSTHFVLDIHKLQMMQAPTHFGMQPHKFGGAVVEPMTFRTASFLNDPRTSSHIKNDIVQVHVVEQPEAVKEGRAVLRRGGLDVSVLEQLAPWREARVLRLYGDPTGAIAGFARPGLTVETRARLFTVMMEYFLYGGSWCCSSRNKEDGRAYSRKPPLLTK